MKLNKIFLLLVLIFLMFFSYLDAFSYVMNSLDDTSSPDRIRRCENINIPEADRLPFDEYDPSKGYRMSRIARNDLVVFWEIIGNIDNYLSGTPAERVDYNFILTNERCAIRAGGLYTAAKLAVKAVQIACGVRSPRTKLYPSPVTDLIIIGKAGLNLSRYGGDCAAALSLLAVPWVGSFAQDAITAELAATVMKRSRLCGHNWTSWNPNTFAKDQVGLYQRRVIKCVECRMAKLQPRLCPENNINAYKAMCNDNHDAIYGAWSGQAQSNLMNYRKYREYLYQGVEREDHNDVGESIMPSASVISQSISQVAEDMKHCIDPTKKYDRNHGDIIKAYQSMEGDYRFYNESGEVTGDYTIGPFALQKYYYRGTNVAHFNCQKYLQEPNIIVKDNGDTVIGDDDGEVLSSDDRNRMQEIYRDAYDCCMRRQTGSICVEYTHGTVADNDMVDSHDAGDYYVTPFDDLKDNSSAEPVLNANYRVCNAGDICVFPRAGTDISPLPLEFDSEYISSDGNRLLCAHTISLCPFDMNIGGGTSVCQYYRDDKRNSGIAEDEECIDSPVRNRDCSLKNEAGKCQNYCQMLNHCVVIDDGSDYNNITINSPYFDISCFDFKGASRYYGGASGWSADFIPNDIIRLSSPIAQCAKETLRNIFYNIAGHDKCELETNNNRYNNCPGDLYKWRRGQELSNVTNDNGEQLYFSFFKFLQDKLYIVIQAFLILYLMFFGIKMLMADRSMPKEEIMMTCFKIGIVMFFATGNAWQNFFFDGIYYAGTIIGNIILDLQPTFSSLIMDAPGQSAVPNLSSASDIADGQSHYRSCYFNYRQYPDHMGYVAIWDTFDCKLAQYLGIGPGFTVGNLAILIVAGFFTGAYGVYFAAMLFTFAIIFFSMIYYMLYLFVMSSSVVVILIFITPIVVVSILFQATKSVFEQWVKQLLESSLQIIILFAFVSIVIFTFDSFLVGSATFYQSDGTVNCDCRCRAPDGYGTPDNDTEKVTIGRDGNLYREYGSQSTAIDDDSTGERKKIDCGNIYQNGLCSQEGFEILDPKADSLLCIVNSGSVSQSSALSIFGLVVPVLNVLLVPDRLIILMGTLIKVVLITYMLNIMVGRISNISSVLMGTKGITAIKSPIDINTLMGKAKQLASLQQMSTRGIGKAARTQIDKMNK